MSYICDYEGVLTNLCQEILIKVISVVIWAIFYEEKINSLFIKYYYFNIYFSSIFIIEHICYQDTRYIESDIWNLILFRLQINIYRIKIN